MNVVILISGRGSNMQAIVNAKIAGADIKAVISNRPDAVGLKWAKEQGLMVDSLNHQDFPDRASFDQALMEKIDAYRPDLVVLAGFMRILTTEFCRHYEGRMMNIHPSLLPSFPGLHTHEQAIAAGCKIAGCTVHFVTEELDHGPIISQAAVPILPYDTAEDVANRVLRCEHQIYPQAVADFVSGSLQLIQGQSINMRKHAQGQEQLLN